MGRKLNSAIDLNTLLTKDYLNLTQEQKVEICNEIAKSMMIDIKNNFGNEFANSDHVKKIVQNTIKQYEKVEDYETCQLLVNLLTYMDE
jgi:chromosome condensin MukBEF ATPase and DNA-binding subunit MukB